MLLSTFVLIDVLSPLSGSLSGFTPVKHNVLERSIFILNASWIFYSPARILRMNCYNYITFWGMVQYILTFSD